ncbi:Patatin-like phospholipase [Cohaesibacter sp. ES.047]|uniref:patatin-like phospholipase family protein n=1 Tax=Cohaesibacter sp. ES.047 TaxID=1798205 RepID=UPI000BB92B70|nr:patatin-like phospholipase family protein [Cohaesibacter sp. ES.047]SNY90314.1 Patatin-like phospholipase [Cohaesibacter sp. ES.047]
MTDSKQRIGPYRILSLDGGGAKGFYTLGVLAEIEGLVGCRLHEKFDLVFGTSTGAIIASMIAVGMSVDEIHMHYKTYVPEIMRLKTPEQKSAKLAALAKEIFNDQKFDAVKTAVGIVTTKWAIERPMIFKGSMEQAHGRKGTFLPGFGVTIGDAVQASCSAYPFFSPKTITTADGDEVELVDGGYCANNPTLYAIADATGSLNVPRQYLRVVSIGVGIYPSPKPSLFSKMWWAKYLLSVQLLQKTLEINTQSMDQLRTILFKDVPTVRVNDTFEQPEMATDLFEHDLKKLNILRQRGRESYANNEATLKKFLL